MKLYVFLATFRFLKNRKTMRSLKYLKDTCNTPKEIVFREKNFKIIIRSAWPDNINEKNSTKMLNYTREKSEKYFFLGMYQKEFSRSLFSTLFIDNQILHRKGSIFSARLIISCIVKSESSFWS